MTDEGDGVVHVEGVIEFEFDADSDFSEYSDEYLEQMVEDHVLNNPNELEVTVTRGEDAVPKSETRKLFEETVDAADISLTPEATALRRAADRVYASRELLDHGNLDQPTPELQSIVGQIDGTLHSMESTLRDLSILSEVASTDDEPVEMDEDEIPDDHLDDLPTIEEIGESDE